MKLSLSEARSVNKIEISRKSISTYCVKIHGVPVNRIQEEEISYTWSSKQEALICARGIGKMFNLPSELILIDSGI
ncbi:hypothetical protein [Paenibacillus sp. FSL H7-0331]|uniref:hypothetical protein n=1 Tax=Paenibacillus sp. FSL H7-0331 TaxID=1920421 RepID=UPI00096D04B5|nr:hypothetical protein [Paenibacillus sp. FSL H7-0331]OMF14865.1 hypothetical protein BK127_16795 [Paenibacillus sp. FSL H7-0331]